MMCCTVCVCVCTVSHHCTAIYKQNANSIFQENETAKEQIKREIKKAFVAMGFY